MELSSNVQPSSPITNFYFIFNKSIIINRLDELYQLSVSHFCDEQDSDITIHSLLKQYKFLGLIYNHHVNAKYEVTFSALGEKIKRGYLIQHQQEKDLFDQILEMLNSNSLKNEIGSQKEFMSMAKKLKQLITQSMAMEEDQLFPLLAEQVSPNEQAFLAWRYLCSIPTYLLAKLLSSLPYSLSAREYKDMIKCLYTIVPKEKLIQQAIFNLIEMKDSNDSGKKSTSPKMNTKCESSPIDDTLLWHKAIRKELNETFEEIKRMYLSGGLASRSDLDQRLKFIAETCLFQSVAKDKVIFPRVFGETLKFDQNAEEQSKFDEYWHLIRTEGNQVPSSSSEFYSKLCSSVDQIMQTINRHMYTEESQVLPLVREKFSFKEQRSLLYQSLCIMPLRLLKQVLPWLVRTMNDEEAKTFLHNLQLSGSVSDSSLVKLFCSWACNDNRVLHESPNVGNDINCEDLISISRNPLKIFNGQRLLNLSHHETRDIFSSIDCTEYPIDVFFKVHKAIRRDLEYLSSESKGINIGDKAFLSSFIGRFCLLWGLYKAHSNSTENIIYPAIESKVSFCNVTHENEEKLFQEILGLLNDLSQLHETKDLVTSEFRYYETLSELQVKFESIRIVIEERILREENDLWPLMRGCFSVEEQKKLVGFVLGTTNAEELRLLLSWLSSALTLDEQTKMMATFRSVTKNTMFEEWLSEFSNGKGTVNKSDQIINPHTDLNYSQTRNKNLLKNHMSSHWMSAHKRLPQGGQDLLGKSASFRDNEEKVFGCKHYKRNCKLRANCCGDLFACRFCHDAKSNHPMDRKATLEMMCMRCLEIQPIGPICNTPSCNGFPMAKYFCNICNLFDDERNIYHCPFCNICRVGLGLGVDYFHCMSCNCCMSITLLDHKCEPKCLETSCPVCDEFLFTSTKPVKSLPCGHFIHSNCFKKFDQSPFKCLICSQSSGGDTKVSEEYSVTVRASFGKLKQYNQIGNGEMEASSWRGDTSEKRVVFGLARIWSERLYPFILWLGNSFFNRGRVQIIGKETRDIFEGNRTKDGLFVCSFVLWCLVMFCFIISFVVFLCLKTLGADKLIFLK